MPSKYIQTPFLLITLALAFMLTLPVLIQDGMFCDAYLYTSVANNLAHNEGSFWFPQFDEKNVENLPSFHEQPPLVFWLESLFFRVLGSSLYTERIYTFVMLLLTILLLKKLWQLIFPDKKEMYWLVVLAWITIPVCFWSYSNCMHENTMGIFCLSSIYFSCSYFLCSHKSIFKLVLAGCFIVLGFLAKGLPGLYPLAIPFCFWVTGKINFKAMILSSSLLFLLLGLFALFVYVNADAHKSIIDFYMVKRLFQRVGNSPTVTNRFSIVGRLFSELIPILSLSLLLFFIALKQKMQTLFFSEKKMAWFFLLLGLCGTLPLMLTSVQKGFYMVAALPCFGLSFAALLAPFVLLLQQKLKESALPWLKIIGISLVTVSLVLPIFFIGKTYRDTDTLHDVYAIGKQVPAGTYFELNDKGSFEDWSFQNYMMRYFHLGLRWKEADYLVKEKNKMLNNPELYEPINIETMKYDFYKRKK